jgi:putative intracellular protease/amidase
VAGYVFSVLAAAGLMTAGVTAAGGLRSADALPPIMLADGASIAAQCSVKVVRTGAPGAAEIVRDQLADGSCVCVVTTGPASNNGSAEDTVTNLLKNRECSSAPAAGSEAAELAKGSSFGPAGAILPIVAGAGGAGGLAAGLQAASDG